MRKIRNIHDKTHRSDNLTSLWDDICIRKDHYLISASLDMFRKFSLECKRNVLQSGLPLNCSFSAHFNEIITQFIKIIIIENLVFFTRF